MNKFILSVALLHVVNMAGAAEPAPMSPFVRPDSDKLLSLSVTAALMNDTELASLPIFVDVFNKVALLGGSVPNEAARQRVEMVVRQVPGLKAVKNGCWINSSEDPLKQMVLDRLDGIPLAKSAPTTPTMPKLTIIPPDLRASAAEPPLYAHPGPNPTKPADRRPQVQVTVNRMFMNSRYPPGLEPPISPEGKTLSELPMPAATIVQSPIYPMIPATAVPIKPRSLEEELRQIQQQSPRWSGLRVSLTGSRVVISGRGPHPADVWALADALREVAGVERIIVRP